MICLSSAGDPTSFQMLGKLECLSTCNKLRCLYHQWVHIGKCDVCIECDRFQSLQGQSAFMFSNRRASVALWFGGGKNNTLKEAYPGIALGASCVQKSDDSRFCNSHCLSHFAAFFIVMGTKISIVENLVLWLSLVRLLCVIRFVWLHQRHCTRRCCCCNWRLGWVVLD